MLLGYDERARAHIPTRSHLRDLDAGEKRFSQIKGGRKSKFGVALVNQRGGVIGPC